MHTVRRRTIVFASAALLGLPQSTRPQATSRTIGFLVPGSQASHGRWVAAFVQRLAEVGWTEGRNVAIDYRWAEGRLDAAGHLAAELVQRKVDVIVTSGSAVVAAVKRATAEIPIVFAAAGDPVGAGLVASLSRPGGNVTGLSIQQTDLAAKRLELLRAVLPGLARVGVLANVAGPSVLLDLRELEGAARALRVELIPMQIRRGEDIAAAFDAVKGRAEALYVANDPLVDTHRQQIQALALAGRLPAMYGSREHVESGGLMSYGASFSDLFRRAAEVVDKILRGAKPADLPVEQPTKFEFVLNTRTAEQLRLTVPPLVLARADSVVP
jgi:putative ABC transport system substrate-binding protein